MVFCGLLGSGWPPAGPPSASAEVRGRGDFEFSLDRAVFMDEGGARLELYVRIPNNELKFKESQGKWKARVALSLVLEESSGHVVLGEKREMGFEEAEEENTKSPLRFNTVVLRRKVEPGDYLLSCRLEDLFAPKLTLLGMMRGRKKASTVEDLPLRVALPGAPGLGGPQFIWEVRKGPGGR